MDYGDLKSLIASYLHRTDLTTLMPTFVEHGRIRMCQDLRVPEMETSGTVTLTAGVGALSSDVVQIRHVQGPTMRLEWADLDQILRLTSESAYTVTGIDIRAPGCGTVEVYYWGRPQTLVGAADSATRTVLSLYPNVWLYAALVEAYVYIQDAANEAAMQSRLDEEVRRANVLSQRVRHGSRLAMGDASASTLAAGSGL